MFNFLKSLFGKSISYGMGAYESPQDARNIDISTVQQPISIPDEFETILPAVENQGSKGKCVGSGMHKIAELYLSKDNSLDLSDDDLYEQCKLIDGIPDMSGTYPSIGAKVLCTYGVATVEAYNSKDSTKIKESRAKHKMDGYAFVPADFNVICQTIYQKKAIGAAFLIDTNWFNGKITKVLKSIGRHYTVLKGYKMSSKTLKGRNSWGVGWIGYIAGIVNSSVKSGEFEVLWDDVKDTIGDIIAFTYIPPQILEEVKKTNYRFTSDMKLGSSGYEVTKLQERLGISPTTGYFGQITKAKVIEYQIKNNIQNTGTVGPVTRKSLNVGTKALLTDAIIQVESMGNDYAIGDLNIPESQGGKAYGCMQIRQGVVDQVNARLGTKYKSKDCLGNRALSLQMWDVYFKIHTNMVTDEDKAKAWNGGAGWKQRVGKPQYANYLKAIDHYWKKVQSAME